jgi:hypothetical protein
LAGEFRFEGCSESGDCAGEKIGSGQSVIVLYR